MTISLYVLMVAFSVFVTGLFLVVSKEKTLSIKPTDKLRVSTNDKSLNWLVKKIRWANNRLNEFPKCKNSTKMMALAVIEKALGLRNETRQQRQVRQMAIHVLVRFTKANPMWSSPSSFGPREQANCLLSHIPIWGDGKIIDKCEDSLREEEADDLLKMVNIIADAA